MKRAMKRLTVFSVGAALALLPTLALADPGDLDGSFGTGGITSIPPGVLAFESSGRSSVVLPGGGVAVAGIIPNAGGSSNFAGVVQFTPSGGLDPAFSTDGLAYGPAIASFEPVYGLGRQSDGHLVVLALVSGTPTLFRFASDGTRDLTFGSGGVAHPAPNEDINGVMGLAIQSDDKILVAGNIGGSDVGVARYTATGTLDAGFGGGTGLTTIDPGADDAQTAGVGVRSDGRILVGGVLEGTGNSAFVARLSSAGVLDGAFGTAGVAKFALTSFPQLLGFTVTPDDGAALVGSLTSDSSVVVRITPAGALDPAFSSDGVATFDFGSGDEAAWSVTPISGGRLAVGGSMGSSKAALASIEADGSLSPGFGSCGVVLPTGLRTLFDVDASTGDKVVATSSTSSGSMAAARFDAAAGGTCARPDLQTRVAGAASFAGDDVYGSDGAGESATAKVSAGKSKSFDIRIQNGGSETDSFDVEGPGNKTGTTVSYLDGATGITGSVTAGTYNSGNLAADASKDIEIKVKVKSNAKKGTRTWLVSGTSVAHPSSEDAIKIVVKVP